MIASADHADLPAGAVLDENDAFDLHLLATHEVGDGVKIPPSIVKTLVGSDERGCPGDRGSLRWRSPA
jgi:hypothetical protein